MKESLDEEKEESSLICSICHKNSLDIKQNNSNLKRIFNEIFKNAEFSELIQICKCKNTININKTKKRDSNIYTHRYCILIKILFNFEIKCDVCNTIFNIKIEKKIDIKKKIYLFIAFLIIYMMHLLIYLFCMFLLFINVILKKYIKIPYKHICPFFAVIFFFINSLFLYFSINKNIKLKNIYFYKYSFNIFDINKMNKKFINEDSELYKLVQEFYQWFYSQSIINLLINKNKKFMIYKGNYLYNNNLREYINKNNIDFIKFIRKDLDLKDNIQNNDTKDIILNNNDNYNILFSNNINNNYNSNEGKKENQLYNSRSKSSSNRNITYVHTNENNNNAIINSNELQRKISNNIGSLNTIDENQKLNNKDFINININPTNSKNINIKIQISGERNSIFDFSSSKEFTIKSALRNRKVLKTALIPKNNIIKNLIAESNSFKRKKRQLNSIKLRQKRLKLKGTKMGGSIEENEEIDFSEFEKIGSKISKKNSKNDLDLNLKYSNYESIKSSKEVNLNISNSDIDGLEELSNKRLSFKNNSVGRHVHFQSPNF
jgi:hypothetical protein